MKEARRERRVDYVDEYKKAKKEDFSIHVISLRNTIYNAAST